eukprot:2126212-Pyramimonas_sp.AAC.1
MSPSATVASRCRAFLPRPKCLMEGAGGAPIGAALEMSEVACFLQRARRSSDGPATCAAWQPLGSAPSACHRTPRQSRQR